jgi:metal-sulfur cluster biosynthetic enzyme
MTSSPQEDAVFWRTLESIPDPEFGINIVDLGLIYSVESHDGDVSVIMTLTTPTCPSGAWIREGVQAALQQVPGVRNVHVAVVFDPPWTTDLLSANARLQLGWQSEPAKNL